MYVRPTKTPHNTSKTHRNVRMTRERTVQQPSRTRLYHNICSHLRLFPESIYNIAVPPVTQTLPLRCGPTSTYQYCLALRVVKPNRVKNVAPAGRLQRAPDQPRRGDDHGFAATKVLVGCKFLALSWLELSVPNPNVNSVGHCVTVVGTDDSFSAVAKLSAHRTIHDLDRRYPNLPLF